MNNFFFIKTFGCQINFDDSEKISNLLIKNNFIKKKNINLSYIIIINTCSVRNNSEKNFYKYLIKIKKKKKNFLLIISGCISSYLSKFLIDKYKFINIIINPSNLYYLPFLIKMYYLNKCKQIKINFLNNESYNIFNVNNNKINNYITITEGCNKFCSYCIVPYTRGKEIYFYLELILNKIFILNKIHKFIYLLGQNVNSYLGKINKNYNKYIYFYLLLNYINEFFFIKNIDFITSYPSEFNYKLINIYKLNNKISNLLHLPIQSCSNKILFLMKRNYKLINYKKIIKKIKKIRFNILISTDIILCFPNENNCDFYKTLIFIEKFLFDRSYVFLYSPRPYTKSYYLLSNISKSIKIKRFNIINYKIKNNIKYINKMILGKIELVFVKNYFLFKNLMYISITSSKKNVIFFFNSKLFIIGKILRLKILKFYNNFFYGKIL